MMAPNQETEVKVGLFVSIGLGLLLLSILLVGGEASFFTARTHYHSHFPAVDGLMIGSKVMLSGIQIGSVDNIEIDPVKRDVKVTFKIIDVHKKWITRDCESEVTTQGVLGDKYITLFHGTSESGALEVDGEIRSRTSQGLAGFLTKSDQLLVQLNSIAKNMDRLLVTFNEGNRAATFFENLAKTSKNMENSTARIQAELEGMKLKSSVNHLNSILQKIDSGQGSVGAMINDPGLYDDAKALIGRANRNRVVRNLVRKTIQDAPPENP